MIPFSMRISTILIINKRINQILKNTKCTTLLNTNPVFNSTSGIFFYPRILSRTAVLRCFVFSGKPIAVLTPKPSPWRGSARMTWLLGPYIRKEAKIKWQCQAWRLKCAFLAKWFFRICWLVRSKRVSAKHPSFFHKIQPLRYESPTVSSVINFISIYSN